MKNFVIHNAAGRIIQTGSVIEAMLDLQADPDNDRFLLEGTANLATDWVTAGNITRRPEMPCTVSGTSAPADGRTVVTLSGVPAGASLRVVGPSSASGVADGSDIALTFALVGRYSVSLELFPYIDFKEVINAT